MKRRRCPACGFSTRTRIVAGDDRCRRCRRRGFIAEQAIHAPAVDTSDLVEKRGPIPGQMELDL